MENFATLANKDDKVSNQKQDHCISVCARLAFVEISGVVVGFNGHQNQNRNRREKLNNTGVEKKKVGFSVVDHVQCLL